MAQTDLLERAAELVGRDQTYCWHPYTQHLTALQSLPVVGARGAELFLADGSSLIDGFSSWWVNLHGHGHPYLIERMTHQLNELSHVAFANLTHGPAVELAERLHRLLPGSPQRLFFSDNGTTAVETALKIALQYWYNSDARTKRRRIVAFHHGFCGESFGAMAVSDRGLFSRPFASHLFPVDFIDPPRAGREELSIARMSQLLESGEIACFIFEPTFQGVGGMLPHSAEALSELIRLCREAGVVTIADEVLTGCGRTGPYFASEKLSCYPDIYCLAKALTGGMVPLGVTACSEEIYERFLDADRSKALLHGHSYTGNPLACAAALASLDLLESEECDRQRSTIESHHRQFALKLKGDPRVRRVDLAGTILAIELAVDGKSSYFSKVCEGLSQFYLDRGLLLRPFGNVIHLIPPYCISGDQLGRLYEGVEESLLWMEALCSR